MSVPARNLTLPEPTPPAADDAIIVTCGACNSRQQASGTASGFTCSVCGSEWRVLRCRDCRSASIVLAGVRTCPRCGHQHRVRGGSVRPDRASWLTDPEPLSVWLGGVKYLGGHAGHDGTVPSAGLLLDRRGIHLRAFKELLSIGWDDVNGVDIEGPLDIADRLSMSKLLDLGASTWAMRVAYLTVRTTNGDAIFEIDGLAPPELHARLSRVLQGLRKDEPERAAIGIDRPAPVVDLREHAAPEPTREPAPVAGPAPEIARAPEPAPAPGPAPAPAATGAAPEPSTLAVDPQHTEAPLEAIVIDALWKLSQLHERGLVTDDEHAVLRTGLMARLTEGAATNGTNGRGPLLRV
jgi:predicted RNA-binding Zn-ribbon protein involved in translation (DUF1610 family)